jgi:hypothetical protein
MAATRRGHCHLPKAKVAQTHTKLPVRSQLGELSSQLYLSIQYSSDLGTSQNRQCVAEI